MVHFCGKSSDMKIVLLGYMGSGKSTVGRLLANRLGFKFIDLDEYIEHLEGIAISRIFEEKGEIYFRRKESYYVSKALTDNEEIVLSLGGGTPCYSKNMDDILELTDKIFYLKLSVNGLAKRLLNEKEDRPLIKDIADDDLPEFVGKHLFERSAYYQKANYTIDCEGKEPESIASKIEKILI